MLHSAVILIYISWFSRGSGELRRAQVATSTTAPTSSATPENQQVCDYYCQYLNGPSSYCKYWQFPRVCQGGDQPCSVDDCDGRFGTQCRLFSVPDGATIPSLPTPSAADAEVCDRYCMLLNGPSSYCKWWQSPPVCLYGDQACGDVNTCEAPIVGSTTFDLDGDQHGGASAACDSYCQELNGEESYCKHWQNPAVCHSGDQPCGPAICDPISTTATTPITTSIGSTTFTSTSSTGSAATTAAQSSTPTTVIVSTSSAFVSAGPSTSSTTGSLVFGGDSDATTSESTECDSYCKSLNGDDSYCKSWLSPAVCQGGDQPCGSSQCAFTSTEPSFGGDADATTTPPSEDTAACDHYCRLLNGEISFCKYWQIPAVCQIGDQPCGDVDICRAPIVGTTTIDLDGDQHADPSPACDAYCQGLNGVDSYCKYWQNPAVCLSGDQPCAPSVCDPSTTTSSVTSTSSSSTVSSEATTVVTTTFGTTTSTTATTPSPTVGGDSDTTTTEGPIFGGDADTTTSPSDDQACDQYCKLLNGPVSYCKSWQTPAVCHSGDQPCGDAEICRAPIVGTTTIDLDGDQHAGPSPACDAYCQGLNGVDSYCKYWQYPAVCLSGDQPCGPSVCDPSTTTSGVTSESISSTVSSEATTVATTTLGTTTSTTATTPSPTVGGDSDTTTTEGPIFGGDADTTTSPSDDQACDQYCKLLNGPVSYCKSWQTPAVCHSGDQPCGDAEICRAPIVGTTTIDLDGDQHAGPSPACDAYCQGLNGVDSYCKYWQYPAVCLSGDQPCGPSVCDPSTTTSGVTSESISSTVSSEATTVVTTTIGTTMSTTATTPSPTVGGDSDTTTTEGPIFGGDADTTTSPSDDQACDHYCKLLNGPESYCKSWQSPAVCQFGDQPCGDIDVCQAPIIGSTTFDLVGDQHSGHSSACDSYCQDLNGATSYCKHWQNPAVCLSGDQPCGPSVCDPITSTASSTSAPTSTSTVTPFTTTASSSASTSLTTSTPVFGGDSDSTTATSGCDSYCKSMNDESSYCKFWLNPPVCQGGDQPCVPSVC